MEHGIVMGPLGDVAYDPLRHYPAVETDSTIGLLTVTNGIQTTAIFETYKMLYHCGANLTKGYLKKIMDGADFEPDSLKTPRIAGVITNPPGKAAPVYLVSIVTGEGTDVAWKVQPAPGTLIGISTYNGNMEKPGAFRIEEGLPVVPFELDTPMGIADFIYDISAATNQGEDIRVCAVGGVRSDDNLTWETAIINRHRD